MLHREDTQIAGFVFKGQVAAETVRRLTEVDKKSADIGFEEIATKVSLSLLDEDHVAAHEKSRPFTLP